MNSAVKQLPRTFAKLASRWAILASLLMSLPALGQVTVTAEKAVTINDATTESGALNTVPAQATPYPVEIKVGDKIGNAVVTGQVTRVQFNFNGLSHTYVADLDSILVSPDGKTSVLFSDVAVNAAASGDYSISAQGALEFQQGMAPGASLAPGTYKPRDFTDSPVDTFPAPAPSGPYGTDLSVFNGEAGKGIWKLFVMDDRTGDAGTMQAPSLTLWFSPVISVTNDVVNMNEDSPFTIPVQIDDTDTAVSGLTLEATSSDQTIVTNTALSVSRPEGSGNVFRLTITPLLDKNGTITVTLKAKDGVAERTKVLTVNVAAVNDVPVVTKIRTDSNTETNIVKAVQGELTPFYKSEHTDIDSPLSASVLSGRSGNTNLFIPSDVVFVTDGSTDGVRRFYIAPKGAASGNTTVDIVATDAGPGVSNSAPKTVEFQIAARTDRRVVANFHPISIPDGGATSARSDIAVSGLNQPIAKVNVTIADITHPNPSDLDVILVGPKGQKVTLFGQSGSTALDRGRFKLDQSAANSIPGGSPIAFNTSYRPADNGSGDSLPSPAPAGPYETSLDAFNGTDANGTWSLFAVDRANGNAGAINGGYIIEIFTAPVFGNIADQEFNEDEARRILNFSLTEEFDAKIKTVVATEEFTGGGAATGSDSILTLKVNHTADAFNGTLEVTPKADQSGIRNVRLVATDSLGFTATRVFKVTVRSINDGPTITPIQKQITYVAQPTGAITFTINDKETDPNNLILSVLSSNIKLLPISNIALGGTFTDRTITLFPAGSESGTVDVTITVTDTDSSNPLSSSITFRLDVLSPASPLFVASAPIVIDDSGAGGGVKKAIPYPSSINVQGLVGGIQRVRVNLYSLKHVRPQEVNIMLVGPGSNPKRVVLFAGAGGSQAIQDVQLRFDDDATPTLPTSGKIGSGVYKPSNNDGAGNASFPDAPAGPEPVATLTSAFSGMSPNGNWSLFVVDELGNDKGNEIAGGWSIQFQVDPVFSPITPNPATTLEDRPIDFTLDIGDDQPGIPTTFNVVSSNPSVIRGTGANSGIVISDGGDRRRMTVTPVQHASGEATLTVTATIGGVSASQSVLVKVTETNDDPTILEIAEQNASLGIVYGPFEITVGDVDDAPGDLTVTAASSNATLPSNNVQVRSVPGAPTKRTITILPANTTEPYTSAITITAQDGRNGKGTRTFNFNANRSLVFANPSEILIVDNSPANPYPSTIPIKGIPGVISRLRVTLRSVVHPFPDDINVLLVSPVQSDGKTKQIVLMANAGGGAPTNSINGPLITFAQGAAAPIGDSAFISSGTYKPSNYGAVNFPSPAPAGPYSADLGDLNGLSPNGDWKLFVYDDTLTDSGRIAEGWSILVETAPSIAAIPEQRSLEDVTVNVNVLLEDADTEAAKLVTTAQILTAPDSGNRNATTNVVFDPGTTNLANRILRINPVRDVNNVTNTIRITVNDGTTTTVREFLYSAAPVNDAPLITTSTNLVKINEDTVTNIVFNISDVDSRVYRTNITVVSGNSALVPNAAANLSFTTPIETWAAGETNTATVQVTPATHANSTVQGDSALTLSVTDREANDPQTSASVVTLNVAKVNDLPTITSISNTNVVAGGSLSGIPFRVADVEDEAKNLSVIPKSSNTAILPNANLVISESNNDRLLALTTVGTTPGVVTVTIEVTDVDGGKTTTSFNVNVTAPEPDPSRPFPNTAEIAIKDNANAEPYPSTINVTGLRGNVYRVAVTLDGFEHSAPDDVDVMLVGPNGKAVVIMSDAGGRSVVSNLRLNFSDSATGVLRDDGPLSSGTYEVSNFGSDVDNFPTVSATRERNFTEAFTGSNPNGNWRLYVVDDTATDSGFLRRGWTLTITTTPTIELAPGFANLIKYDEDTVANSRVIVQDVDANTSAAGLEITKRSSNTSVIAESGINVDAGTGNVVITPVKDAYNEQTNLVVTLTVTRKSDKASQSLNITNVIEAVNDRPALSRITDRATSEGVPIDVPFIVIDANEPTPNDPVTLAVVIEDQVGVTAQSVVAYTNITLNGVRLEAPPKNVVTTSVSANNTISIAPNVGNAGITADRSTFIRITATDSSKTKPSILTSNPDPTSGGSGYFKFTVKPKNDAPSIDAIADKVVAAGQNLTFNIVVADPDSTSDIVVTASSDRQDLVKNSSIKITPEKGGVGNRQLSLTAELGVQGDANITLVADDGKGGVGNRSFKVSVRPSRERRYDGKQIVINDLASATPYPSIVSVDDLVGNVSQVRVEIGGFEHGYPDDVDIVLVSPSGKKVALMSDAGGSTSVTNLTFVFDQNASGIIPDSGPLVSGSFRPANHDIANDTFPSGGPVSPFETDLTKLNGEPAKGEWKLFVADDTRQDAGLIKAWSLYITTAPRIDGLASTVTVDEDNPFVNEFTIVEESFASGSFTSSTSSTNLALIRPQDMTVSNIKGDRWQVSGTPLPNAFGRSEITVLITNSFGQVSSGKFALIVNSVEDAPIITKLADQRTFSGTAIGPVPFDYSDAETAKKDLLLEVSSSNTNLVPVSNISIIGNELLIAPVGAEIGTTRITLKVTDKATPRANSDETTFTLTVDRALQAQGASSSRIEIVDNQKASPYPSVINVTGVKSKVAKVTVTIAGLEHKYPADVDILLVGPGGQSAILMSDAGGGRELVSTRLTFDDEAAGSLPFNPTAPIGSGTYKPTNHAEGSAGDPFPADAPAAPYGAALSVFKNSDANGDWRLYVVDDVSPDKGAIVGGWVLNIFTTEPRIEQVADQVTDENVPLTVGFRVEDTDTPANNLIVEASVDRTSVISAVETGGTGNNRTVKITPAPFASGEATVTLVVRDGDLNAGGSSASTSFKVTVNGVNQPPTITGLKDAATPGNRDLIQLITVLDNETAADGLSVGAIVDRTQFGSASVEGTGESRSLVFKPSGLLGQTAVSVVASDGQLSTTNVITVTITEEYVLTVSAIGDQNMIENEAPRTVNFTVTGSTTGNISVEATSNNSVLIRSVVVSGTGANRSAIITLQQDQFGEAVVTIGAIDDLNGIGSTSFKVLVAKGNRPPVIGPIAPVQTRPNVPAIVNLVISDEDTALQSLVLTSENSNASLVRNVVFGFNGTGFTAQVNLVRDASGSATVTIRASDGFSTTAQSFVLTVVENPPTLAPIADQTTFANQPVEIVLNVTDIDTPLNELVFSATASNPSLVSGVVFDVSSGVAKATVNTVKDATGISTVTITVKDSINSASQTFALDVNPAAPPQIQKPTVTVNPDGSRTLTVTWDNGGELEYADSATGPWVGTGNTSGSYSEPVTSRSRVFRVRR